MEMDGFNRGNCVKSGFASLLKKTLKGLGSTFLPFRAGLSEQECKQEVT